MSTISPVNGLDSSVYTGYAKSTTKAEKTETTTEDVAAVFEKSEEDTTPSTAKTYTPNTALVNQLKADADARTEQLKGIVEKLISGQGQTYSTATGKLWEIFANGDYSTVSEAAIAQAKEDIAEGGYYSVDETSKRILDFAKALTGGDPSKIDEMQQAFEKGYKEATKAWGKDLPEISSQTYDAVMKGFESWRSESAE